MSGKRILEIACFRPESAFIAEQAGADRVELCDDQAAGGVTPAREGLDRVRHLLTIDLFVMIRPRGGDFVYTEDEFAQMKRDVAYCKSIGCEGVVFGILMPRTNCVDRTRCAELVSLAYPMQCTFHRAIRI
jgi:copper homeostasis protein